MRSEERRAIVLLGITAVLATYVATMDSLIWTGAKRTEDFFFNFPCTAVPHLTVYDVSLLQPIINAWIVYAILIFFYFAEDWFPSRRGRIFRTVCHALAAVSMGYYFLYAVWFIPAAYIALVWVPVQFGALYAGAVVVGLFYIEIRFVELVTDSRGTLRRVLRRIWMGLGEPRPRNPMTPWFQLTARRFWSRFEGILPEDLRNGLIRLGESIRGVVEQRRLRGRINMFRTYLLTLLFFALVFSLLYDVYCGMSFLR